ncbi:MAG TPA: hypothetical protein VLZ83_12315 [Edaphocola sp.]|nr:hypothetical protein [Edaphocola sp.]
MAETLLETTLLAFDLNLNKEQIADIEIYSEFSTELTLMHRLNAIPDQIVVDDLLKHIQQLTVNSTEINNSENMFL